MMDKASSTIVNYVTVNSPTLDLTLYSRKIQINAPLLTEFRNLHEKKVFYLHHCMSVIFFLLSLV